MVNITGEWLAYHGKSHENWFMVDGFHSEDFHDMDGFQKWG